MAPIIADTCQRSHACERTWRNTSTSDGCAGRDVHMMYSRSHRLAIIANRAAARLNRSPMNQSALSQVDVEATEKAIVDGSAPRALVV